MEHSFFLSFFLGTRKDDHNFLIFSLDIYFYICHDYRVSPGRFGGGDVGDDSKQEWKFDDCRGRCRADDGKPGASRRRGTRGEAMNARGRPTSTLDPLLRERLTKYRVERW